MVQVQVSALAIDAGTNSPIVLLKEEKGEKILPIWIGYPEASAIALAKSFEKSEIERPLTHDLLKMVLDALDAKLIKVVIDELEGTTYKAKLFLQSGNTDCYIDSRPSDAIAIALRTSAPIFIEEMVFGKMEKSKEGAPDIDDLRKRLRDIDPSDFGKFTI
jgi:bifunctional DNase/RNase